MKKEKEREVRVRPRERMGKEGVGLAWATKTSPLGCLSSIILMS